LESGLFSEPNPFNPPGNLRPQDMRRPIVFDLTSDIPSPRLERLENGKRAAVVRAYTDLKRHVICDEMDPFFGNERVVQGGVPTNQFITRKLWDVGNTAPYGHRGDLCYRLMLTPFLCSEDCPAASDISVFSGKVVKLPPQNFA
jgi:hypothetical protein